MQQLVTGLRNLFLGGFTLMALAGNAEAHPHVLVSPRAEIVFDEKGKAIAIKETWTFDEMYTAFAITGFGKEAMQPTPAQLHGIAQQNIEDMDEYKYFTVFEAGHGKVAFSKPTDYSAEMQKTKDDISLVLKFTLPLKEPIPIAREATLQVYDPSYFVAFTFSGAEPVTLVGNKGICRVKQSKAQALNAIDQQSLSESFFTNMLPGVDFGVKLADRVQIICH